MQSIYIAFNYRTIILIKTLSVSCLYIPTSQCVDIILNSGEEGSSCIPFNSWSQRATSNGLDPHSKW